MVSEAQEGRMLRRGLPRVPGGEPWPPAGASAGWVPSTGSGTQVSAERGPSTSSGTQVLPAETEWVAEPVEASPHETPSSLRRGLPRTPGGEPWPPVGAPAGRGPSTGSGTQVSEPVADPVPDPEPVAEQESVAERNRVAEPVEASAHETPVTSGIRRGLPRTPGGEPWPPAGTVAGRGPSTGSGTQVRPVEPDGPAEQDGVAEQDRVDDLVEASPRAALVVTATAPPRPPTAWNGTAPRRIATAAAASARPRPTWTQGIAVLFGAAALGVLAAAAVALVRTLLSFPFMQDFLAAFPGEYTSPIAVEPGFAPWVGWQHFFNVFLMVLIIRSGLRVRTEKRPTVFWAPRGNPKGKISLTLWFHQALDILWLVNGVVFVVLLIVTGHWVRIVPTSWEVFPNALSAALQYVSFDWPHENGWNNYNSLQQLAYFATVFIAAPLAAITGFRMSGLWPKKAEKLSKAYPVEWARALHFPIMLYFVAFIIAHVALVILTGFLRNLNHMYASQDAVTWTGFWVFVVSLVVIAGAWVAARPLVLAPIAKVFGNVSGR
ncbi:cytochrome b/b6 domain-containing protein [Microbacterium sp. kSW2-24]|nr:cytochrome b/b6 domain-containing protein [Microbacterium galbinum]